jgi:hypothetical protein
MSCVTIDIKTSYVYVVICAMILAGATGEPSMSGPDDIERRLREMEAELGEARVKEPSAAERARRAAQKTGWRNARKARKLRKPVPGPGRSPKPSRRGRIWSLVVAVVVLACLAAAAVAITRLAKHPPKLPAAASTPAKNGRTPTSQPTTAGAPGAAFLPTPTLAAPFLGTPAQHWANGTAGIVTPPPLPVGGYSAAQVAAAYQMTKKLLAAADLDPATVRGGSPGTFASLLIQQERAQFLGSLHKTGRDSTGAQRSSRQWVVSFAPGSVQLVGNVIKVHGAMEARTGSNGGQRVLRIHVNYLFVYAVEEPDNPLTLMRIVRQEAGDIDFAAYDDPGGPLEPWWQVGEGTAGARCDATDGYIHPQFANAQPDKAKPSGPPIDPYDQNNPLVTSGHCFRTTGT